MPCESVNNPVAATPGWAAVEVIRHLVGQNLDPDPVTVLHTARRLGITIAATKSRLYRGHMYLRDRMLPHCGRRGAATLTRIVHMR